ncbi:MAG: AMP-dependent synthetase/ligase [Pseudonocardia sp.]|nr:AMP-dependent synthetase/ligase [Pseudonocardia sp.]
MTAGLTTHLPDGPDLPDDRGLAHIIDVGLARDPHATALSWPDGDGWADRTWTQLATDVEAAAARLVGRGVGAGDRLGVLGRNSYAWAVADLAAAAVGVILVPLFPTSSTAQMSHVLRDSGAVACLAEDGREADVPEVPAWSLTGLLDGGPGWEAVADTAERRAAVRADDIASLVYTSGTTGPQKGCVLTHRNMFAAAAAVVEQSTEMFAQVQRPATLVVLPLSHVFGRTVLQGALYSGSRTGLLAGVADLPARLAAFEPTWLAVVPYALEKLRKGMGDATTGRHPLLGTALRHVICGGARLDPVVGEFFAAQGVTVLQAYGLTESATAVTLNVPSTNRFTTVGRPVPGTLVDVAPDGELLVRGRQVSPGYWPDPQASPDGWLHTGDLAEIEPDGTVRITGRRKEILVTTGGKNVAPAPLEDRLRLHPLIANAMVVADDRPYVTALIVLEPGADPFDPEVGAGVERAVAVANAQVSRAESIRRWSLLTSDFSVTAGHLTPTLKLRRAAIAVAFHAEIKELYP